MTYVFALQNIFNAKSKTQTLQIKNRLANFKSVEDYISKLTSLAEEVCEANVALDDSELSLIALNGLHSTYDGFVMTDATQADNIPFSAFQGFLQAHNEPRSSRPTTTQ